VGVDVVAMGEVPTPGVGFAARNGGFGLGAVISASHNPAPDNGIKFLTGDGRKTTDSAELRIEALMDEPVLNKPTGSAIGYLRSDRTWVDRYAEFLIGLVPERLDGMRLCIDAAHGAAHELANHVLETLGATVEAIGVSPNGDNINAEGGATKPETIQELTLLRKGDLGIAFDGDADRAVFSDTEGRLINGDRLIAIWAAHQQSVGLLGNPVVVGTLMSNGGFETYLRHAGIELDRADVGDKYVAQRIEERHARIGGEQSGHIIFPDNGPTGDGLATALELLRVIRQSGKTSTQLYESYESWPQSLVNLEVANKDGWQQRPAIIEALSRANQLAEGRGRVNVRASGTQPILRVMVEASTYGVRDEISDDLVRAILAELGGEIYSRTDLTNALGD
jgi:phosphoglucosamine mutase